MQEGSKSSNCVHWDVTQNGKMILWKLTLNHVDCVMTLLYTGGFGAWSPDGCTEVVTGSGNEKFCECTQLAHFGILFVSVHSYLLCRLTVIALLFCTGSESETTSTSCCTCSVCAYIRRTVYLTPVSVCTPCDLPQLKVCSKSTWCL